VDFKIAIKGLFEEPAAEAADAFTNAPNLETVMKCKLGMLRTQPLISLGPLKPIAECWPGPPLASRHRRRSLSVMSCRPAEHRCP